MEIFIGISLAISVGIILKIYLDKEDELVP